MEMFHLLLEAISLVLQVLVYRQSLERCGPTSQGASKETA